MATHEQLRSAPRLTGSLSGRLPDRLQQLRSVVGKGPINLEAMNRQHIPFTSQPIMAGVHCQGGRISNQRTRPASQRDLITEPLGNSLIRESRVQTRYLSIVGIDER